MQFSVNDPVFQRRITKLHKLGPRSVGEFLIFLVQHGAKRDMGQLADDLRVFCDIGPRFLQAARGDEWPAIPLHEVKPDGGE